LPTKLGGYFGAWNGDTDSSGAGGFASDRVIARVSGGIAQAFSARSYFGVEIDSIDGLMTLEPQRGQRTFPASPADNLIILTLKDKGRDAVMEAVAILNNTPGVVYAEPDYIVSASNVIPNDTHFDAPNMWGLKKIFAPDAWAINTGSKNVVVAVIDTGIDFRHPDLAANIWRNPGEIEGDGIDNDGNGFTDDIRGWSFTWGEESNNGTLDLNGHGSHVAGIIGAAGDNGVGTVGVNWSVSLMTLRAVMNTGDSFTSDIIKAIDYARLMQAPIINNSYGGVEYSQAHKDAIDNTDALFVVAAGNKATNNDSAPVYPASYGCPNIITVAATTFDDSLAPFSNYGAASVHIAAPGDSILSTTPVGTYGILSGTSMATAYVTGAAALVLADNPSMTAQQLKARLLESADQVPALAGKVSSGGRLNVHRALDLNAPESTPYIPVFPEGPPPFTGFAGGNGSFGDPYKVSTPVQLNAVRDYPDKHFIQINDIDMTYDTRDPNGIFYNETMGWKPIEYITGTYNGDGHIIAGLKIGRMNSGAGLFAINYGWIMNLGLQDNDIVFAQGGSIAGNNFGTIANCYNTGRVTGFGGYVSGIAGGGEITNCYNTGEISEVSDYVAIVGGISSTAGKITDCYNTGSVCSPHAADHRPGGIASYGFISKGHLVKYCYNTGIVTTPNGFGYGAVVCYDVDGGIVENSYCLGLYGGSVGTVLTDSQMKQRLSFIDWDFTSIWGRNPDINNGYPILRIFNNGAPSDLDGSEDPCSECGQTPCVCDSGDSQDAQKVAADKAALTWDVIKGANSGQASVTANLTLPASGASGAAITWATSDPSCISAAGTVARPPAGSPDKTVKLTATIKSGSVSDTVTFTLTVPAQAGGANENISAGYMTELADITITEPEDEAPIPASQLWINPFIDVHESDWFYDAVKYAHQTGLVAGTSATTFNPQDILTRGMMVMILWNHDGKPESGSVAFVDVPDGAWYTDAVNWAAANGIAAGYGNEYFGPGDGITREQMSVMLHNYAKFIEAELPNKRAGSFIDDIKISPWAKEAVDAMYAAQILNGKGENMFDPQGKATRAEVVTMMRNFIWEILPE